MNSGADNLRTVIDRLEQVLPATDGAWAEAGDVLLDGARGMIDAVGRELMAPVPAPKRGRKTATMGVSAHERQEAELDRLNRKPRAHKTPSTVLDQVRRSASGDNAEAIDATATEDVITAVRGGSATAVEVVAQTSLPIKTVSRILAKLTRAKLVQKTGTRRGCRYAIPGRQAELGL